MLAPSRVDIYIYLYDPYLPMTLTYHTSIITSDIDDKAIDQNNEIHSMIFFW